MITPYTKSKKNKAKTIDLLLDRKGKIRRKRAIYLTGTVSRKVPRPPGRGSSQLD